MDGIEKLKGVTIIAATNRPDCIDPVGFLSDRIEYDVLWKYPLLSLSLSLGIDASRTFRSSCLCSITR